MKRRRVRFIYLQLPSWTISNGPLSGFKKGKTCTTFLACCSNDGSERIPLVIIGQAWKPRPFKGKSSAELRFECHAYKKAWITKALFFSWLVRLVRYVQRTERRKILLLVDNCSVRGKKEELSSLTNVGIMYLLPDATSKIQPLEAVIFVWVKAQYKRRMLFRVFENMDVVIKSTYNVAVLTAMRWTCEE